MAAYDILRLHMTDGEYLNIAVAQAIVSFQNGGFPAGSILVKDGEILGREVSAGSLLLDPTSHSDIAVIRQVCGVLETVALPGCTLYSSMEPCLMCFHAGCWAGIERVVYGCRKTSDMVLSGYYEGSLGAADALRYISRPPEMVFLPGVEETVRSLIREWEEQVAGAPDVAD